MRLRMMVCGLAIVLFPVLALAQGKNFSASKLRGEPTFEAGKVSGFFIWTDSTGLHVRWSTNGAPLLFSGKLEFDRPFEKLTRVYEEGGGWVRNHGERIAIFSTTLRKEVDGFDIALSGQRKIRVVELKIEQIDAASEEINLGPELLHPQGFPFFLYAP